MRQYLRQGSEGDIGSGYQIYVGIYFKKKKIYIYIYIYNLFIYLCGHGSLANCQLGG
jgi:hypothetical protein